MDNYVEYLDTVKNQKSFDYIHASQILYLSHYHYNKYYMDTIQQNVKIDKTNSLFPEEQSAPYTLFTPNYSNNMNIWRDNNTVYKNKVIQENPKKDMVQIDDPIESIGDILSILDKHKFDINKCYNIDLLAMNMVKNELIELNAMVGMKSLKSSVLNQMLYFMQDLHLGKESDFKHTVISGPPGTGKTEIAKIMGKMYSKLGILKKTIFKKVTRNDLIAGYLGQTALKTKGVINDCLGGVLFIDEAYSLGTKENGDSFANECIDILCESLSDHKDELMVIIAGYKEELNSNFFSMNKGLSSRFVWRFDIENYTCEELKEIFIQKIKNSDWSLDENILPTDQWFKKNYKTFKNYGRDMELLFFYTKISHGKRIFGKDNSIRKKIMMEDLDNGYKLFLENVQSKENREIFGLYV